MEKGLVTGVIKPFQTGTELDGLSDAEFIYGFLGRECVLSEVSPFRLRAPLSPYRAAEIEGVKIPLEDIISTYAGLYLPKRRNPYRRRRRSWRSRYGELHDG